MKLLLKLLGVSDYIEELENNYNDALESISQLHKDKDVLAEELEETFSSLNQLLATKSSLTAEVLKLREQLEEVKITNEQLTIAINELENTNKNYLNYDKEFRTSLSNQLQRLAGDIVDCL